MSAIGGDLDRRLERQEGKVVHVLTLLAPLPVFQCIALKSLPELKLF